MSQTNTVFVLGGDGLIGWPLSLRLSSLGFSVVIVDNLVRRDIDVELQVESLVPIQSIESRLQAWKEVSGKEIKFVQLDLANDFQSLLELVKTEKPSTIFDLAKLKSAPYSMRSRVHRARTLFNNLGGCENVLSAIVESGLHDIHLVHIGTMGVYGYNPPTSAPLPEGYIKVKVPETNEPNSGLKDWTILYPSDPGSLYHLTKTQEALHFQFYNKVYGIKITDLHQGVVWGTQTEETRRDPRLSNRFDYDGDYGTVLNRFLIQAAVGHPLTIYGTGGQTRAFIHLLDCLQCLLLAMNNPPKKGDKVHIYNQATQCCRVSDLADMIVRLSPGTTVDFLLNPRPELLKNELDFVNSTLLGLGLKPTLLSDALATELMDIARLNSDRIQITKVKPGVNWNVKSLAKVDDSTNLFAEKEKEMDMGPDDKLLSITA